MSLLYEQEKRVKALYSAVNHLRRAMAEMDFDPGFSIVAGSPRDFDFLRYMAHPEGPVIHRPGDIEKEPQVRVYGIRFHEPHAIKDQYRDRR